MVEMAVTVLPPRRLVGRVAEITLLCASVTRESGKKTPGAGFLTLSCCYSDSKMNSHKNEQAVFAA